MDIHGRIRGNVQIFVHVHVNPAGAGRERTEIEIMMRILVSRAVRQFPFGIVMAGRHDRVVNGQAAVNRLGRVAGIHDFH